MYEVFNKNTLRVQAIARDKKEALRKAHQLEQSYYWIDGSKFSFRFKRKQRPKVKQLRLF